MKKLFGLLLNILFASLSFGQTEEKKVFTFNTIGWTIERPEGWTIVSKETNEKREKKGLDAMEETLGQEIDISGLRQLISFQKNKSNIFISTTEPFNPKINGDWKKNTEKLKDLLVETYANKNIKTEASTITTETIDDLDFQVYTLQLYTQKGDLFLTQIMYTKLLNGLLFSVCFSYNDEGYKEEILTAWRNSKFKKHAPLKVTPTTTKPKSNKK